MCGNRECVSQRRQHPFAEKQAPFTENHANPLWAQKEDINGLPLALRVVERWKSQSPPKFSKQYFQRTHKTDFEQLHEACKRSPSNQMRNLSDSHGSHAIMVEASGPCLLLTSCSVRRTMIAGDLLRKMLQTENQQLIYTARVNVLPEAL